MDFARRTYVEEDGAIRPAYDPAIASGMEGDEPSTVPPDLWPMWDALAGIPILLIRGAITDLLSAETAAKMEERHKGFFERVEIPDTGHAPILDEPEAVTAIRRFLKQHSA